jgi:hypothetical protein
MIQSEHFGKEQSQMLIAVAWIAADDYTENQRNLKKLFYVFTSSYLTHSSLLFQKCYDIFLKHIAEQMNDNIEEEIILSDGSSQQFKNKNNFYWASESSFKRGTVFSNVSLINK